MLHQLIILDMKKAKVEFLIKYKDIENENREGTIENYDIERGNYKVWIA